VHLGLFGRFRLHLNHGEAVDGVTFRHDRARYGRCVEAAHGAADELVDVGGLQPRQIAIAAVRLRPMNVRATRTCSSGCVRCGA
jgi:hypothetical protein